MSQPKIIKRYQNRKLYDTQSSCYVTLEDIAGMIKRGEDVSVIDNKTKEDLTSVTLTQIIYEEEKKQRSILPLDALKKLIRSSGESLTDMFEKVIHPGLTTIQTARDEVEKVIGKLVKRGRLDPVQGGNLVAELKEGTNQWQRRFEQSWTQVTDVIKSLTVLKKQVDELEDQVDQLTKAIEKIKKKGSVNR